MVIGAGPNGLVAANLLVDAGWSVEVLEARDEPGGALRSDRGVHPDYISDVFSAFCPMAAASPVIEALDLGREGLRWSHAPYVLAHPIPSHPIPSPPGRALRPAGPRRRRPRPRRCRVLRRSWPGHGPWDQAAGEDIP